MTPLLYAANVRVLENPVLFEAAYRAASPRRREKVDRLRNPQDRRLSLGAEALLRHGLSSLGAGDLPLDFRYGPEGKPYLTAGGLFFNLSHAGDWALCALAEGEVGCDVEKVSPIDPRLAERVFSPEEAQTILAQPTPEGKIRLFYRCWTLKESVQKATGLGMKLPPHSFQVLRGTTPSLRQAVNDRAYCFREYQSLDGYACALCASEDCRGTELHSLTLTDIFL